MASNMVPQEELPVLESFINIRNRLTALKKVSLKLASSRCRPIPAMAPIAM
jgi:hypothetical protein